MVVDLDPCSPKPCGDNKCVKTMTGFTCICKEGYTGSTCDTLVDHCTDATCEHGGTCVSNITGFVCTCRSRYSGTFCERCTFRENKYILHKYLYALNLSRRSICSIV